MDDHRSEFPLELDHLFVWVSAQAPEAEALEKLGLRRPPRIARHVGQGTASTFFMFDRNYLELIWIDDEPAARPGMLTRSRWRQNGACPFGVGLRRCPGTSGPMPFPATPRRAGWMRPGTAIEVADSNENLAEPWCFVVPDYMVARASSDQPPEAQEFLTHPLGVKRLTGVKIVLGMPGPLPETCSLLSAAGVVAGVMNLRVF